MNGKLSTHSLAVLLTQPSASSIYQEESIPRLNKTEMSKEFNYKFDIFRYNGPKKSKFPTQFLKKPVPSLKILAHEFLSQERARQHDFTFLKDIILSSNCLEFNGYNTCLHRVQGRSPELKTKAVYLPLIDMTPAHPDSIMTALIKAQQLTEKIGQHFTVFTAD